MKRIIKKKILFLIIFALIMLFSLEKNIYATIKLDGSEEQAEGTYGENINLKIMGGFKQNNPDRFYTLEAQNSRPIYAYDEIKLTVHIRNIYSDKYGPGFIINQQYESDTVVYEVEKFEYDKGGPFNTREANIYLKIKPLKSGDVSFKLIYRYDKGKNKTRNLNITIKGVKSNSEIIEQELRKNLKPYYCERKVYGSSIQGPAAPNQPELDVWATMEKIIQGKYDGFSDHDTSTTDTASNTAKYNYTVEKDTRMESIWKTEILYLQEL